MTAELTPEQRVPLDFALIAGSSRWRAPLDKGERIDLLEALVPTVAAKLAAAKAEALREARDDLYAGMGPDLAADSDIVYGEWLGNRADRIGAVQ